MTTEPGEVPPSRPRTPRATALAVTLLVLHAGLVSWVSLVNSPNLDEPAHLASGISHWEFGRFDLYRVNPPLVRMIASMPLVLFDVKTDWSGWNPGVMYSRPEFHAGTQLVILNGEQSFWYFALARWICLPLVLAGLWIVYRWGSELYGPAAGLTAMSLYAFCPNMIAWGASITPDAAGASMGVLAAYTFWRWLKSPTWRTAFLAGLGLALAELTKGTWVILFVLWPILWVAVRGMCRSTSPQAPLNQLLVILGLAVYLLNLGYGFEGSFKPLGEYRFACRTLSGENRPREGGNRFRGTVLERVPVPLPENYVRGLDVQKYDFEQKKWSYLNGEQKKGGWWYYYLEALLVKSPLGTLVLAAIATAIWIKRRNRAGCLDELLVLVPGLVVLGLVSSQTGFSRYLRYALPVLPFLYLHCGRVVIRGAPRWRTAVAALAVTIAAVESLAAFPHSMSFFQTAIGGPHSGPRYLVDANVDWGQDLLFLKRWYDANPQARPLHLEFFGHLDISPKAAGIEAVPVPGYLPPDDANAGSVNLQGPQPGWFALSVNHIQGYHHYESDRPRFTYFQHLRPVAQAGYSIRIYRLSEEEANALRVRLNLPPVAPEHSRGTTAAPSRN